jgi:prepilin-type N-terminal cleavage/methylation domain-containing protein
MKRQQGFTLIELMIVVAIIAIIAAIAIPSLLNARKAGNEASAISSLRTLTTVNEQYRTRFRDPAAGIGYTDSLANLLAAGYIDDVLGTGAKSGYTFTYVLTNENEWNCTASPQALATTGDRSFFVDQTGVIRGWDANVNGNATVAAPPIDN